MPDESKKALAQKLLEVGKRLGFLEFDAKNSGMGYGYASAAGVIRKLNVALSEVGVTVLTREALVAREPLENGSVRSVVQVTLFFRDVDSGEEVATQGLGEGQDKGDKATMKASTAAYKYAIAHALVLGWGAEDPEADEETDKPAPRREPAKRPSKAAKADGPLGPKFAARLEAEGATPELRKAIIAAKDALVEEGAYEGITAAFKAAAGVTKEAN